MRELRERSHYLDALINIDDPGIVRVITGVRRCGKSALLALYRSHLVSSGIPESAIISINFEDLANDELRDPQRFSEFVRDHVESDGARFLHVDEVQELDDWARVINSLRLSGDLDICVTGSNASMFTGESATYLAGRYIEIPMYPLSLAEFIDFRGLHDTSLIEAYQEWLRIGGFPASALTQNTDVIRQLNSALFDSIFTRDIALRGQIRDTDTFLRVAQFTFDNAGSPLSIHKIAQQLKAHGSRASSELVDRYLGLMEDAHLVYRCRRYDTQGKRWLRTHGKFYFVDPSLRNSLLGNRDFNRGRDLENMVYLELRRRGYSVSTGSIPGGEIDFIAHRESTRFYIQVAYMTESDATLSRELAPFEKTPPGSRCILLTLDRLPPSTGNVQWLDACEFLAGASLPDN